MNCKKKNILIINSINNVPSNRQYYLLSKQFCNVNCNVIHVTDTNFSDTNFLGTILYWKNKRFLPSLFFFLKIIFKYRCFNAVILNFSAISYSFLFKFFSDETIITYQSDFFPKGNFHRLKSSLKFLFCNKIITVSDYMKQKIKNEFYFIKKKEIIVFKNSIDTQKYATFIDSNFNRSKDEFLHIKKVIFVGNLELHKGFDVLMNYFANNEILNLQLTIVGNGSLVKSIPENTNKIVYLGTLSHDAVLAEMSRNHFIIIPSRKEAFGQVAIEAMLMKTVPVIAKGTGASEIITDKTGFGFNEINEAISFIKNCKWDDYEIISKNIASEIENFDSQKWINDYMELLYFGQTKS